MGTSNVADARGEEAAAVRDQREPLSSSNGHTNPGNFAATPSRRLSEPSHHSEANAHSGQSPASALADLLSSLELSTPAAQAAVPDRQSTPLLAEQEPIEARAANGHAPSKLEAGRAELAASAQHPRQAQAGDVAVGLVYDPLMEDHTGPPGKPTLLILVYWYPVPHFMHGMPARAPPCLLHAIERRLGACRPCGAAAAHSRAGKGAAGDGAGSTVLEAALSAGRVSTPACQQHGSCSTLASWASGHPQSAACCTLSAIPRDPDGCVCGRRPMQCAALTFQPWGQSWAAVKENDWQ